MGRADARLQTQAFWSLAMYLLNGTLFVLVGLEAQAAVRSLSGTDLTGALVTVAVVSVTLAVVRFTFLTASSYTIRLLDRRPQQLERRMGHRARVVRCPGRLPGSGLPGPHARRSLHRRHGRPLPRP
ncbi:hypothetical protein [Streptomyces diastaticus]|uniref:hypothetical protein n=1 Tax=Streptomyces diastaticus TaxID=1956 RepID=UPI003D186E56